MSDLFKENEWFYGYCDGLFGGNDYKRKQCISVGDDCAVFEYYDNGSIVSLNIGQCLDIDRNDVKKWIV